MWCLTSNCIFLTAALFTIVQTIPHLLAIIYGYFMYLCDFTPNYDNIFLYLTYFYQKECGHIHIEENSLILWKFLDVNQRENFKEILNNILDDAIFPENSPSLNRISFYIFISIVFDGLWILAAFTLLVGICLRVKGSIILFFNLGWILSTILILLIDLISTAYYLLDLPITKNFDEWFQFVGIENSEGFHYLLNNKTQIPYLTQVPTLTIVLVTSKFYIIWGVNLILLISVCKRTKLLLKKKLIPTILQTPNSTNNSQFFNLDASEIRIQSWRQFYGAIENTSSRSSSTVSLNQEQQNINKDFNLNDNELLSGDDFLNIPIDEQQGFVSTFRPSIISRSTNFYYPFIDVTDGVNIENNPMVELRSQLPWSYFPNNKRVKALEHKP